MAGAMSGEPWTSSPGVRVREASAGVGSQLSVSQLTSMPTCGPAVPAPAGAAVGG